MYDVIVHSLYIITLGFFFVTLVSDFTIERVDHCKTSFCLYNTSFFLIIEVY